MRIDQLWRSRNGNEEALAGARRDAIVLGTLICAVLLLIWNGSHFFHAISFTEERYGIGIKVASTALTLNVALILFGWRRYVDLQHEAEKRAEGEARAAQIASTDAMTGLLNRKGFADRGETMAADCARAGAQLAVLSVQLHRGIL